jgi:type III pantothenate kinase
MIIVVDAGNTRLKWARAEGGRPAASDSVVHSEDLETAMATFAAALPAQVTRVLDANVAGPRMEASLRETLRGCGLPAPEFVVVAAEAHGVQCGYSDPGRLGVDRWVAAVAAYAVVGDAVAVIDAGTTITLDVVDADGRHLGGLIFAGPGLTAAALQAGTRGIGRTAIAQSRPVGIAVLGRSTDEAVGNAALLGVAAGLERALDAVASELTRRPAVVLTGGDAGRLQEWLETDVHLRADLVLEGLALMAENRQI